MRTSSSSNLRAHAGNTITILQRVEGTYGRLCHHLSVIEDADIISALGRVATRTCPAPHAYLSYDITDVHGGNGFVDFALMQLSGAHARLRLSLPSSRKPQPWLYAHPEDAEDWVGQLLTWLDEEVFTLGLVEGRVRQIENGESYVTVELYGWRLSDVSEHER
jgi:hypothetical protein